MGNLINVDDFMQLLQDRGLVIVSATDFQLNKSLEQQRLLKKKYLTLTEVVKGNFFPIKDSETLRRWCLDGKFGPDGFIKTETGRYKILTSRIKHLLYGN
jgi:hypothetical protein